MAPVPVPVAGARRETIEQPKRASGRSFASVVTRKRPSLNRAGDFAGVLVSDFYSAYDSVTCHQQKCHLHLMRDINDDLLHNPFDEELKELARRYTLTLKPMVETIDKHGLKTKFLSKHKRNAEAFLNWIGKQEVTSDVAQGYKSRIEKYGERLFTFLDYDGVPWNNNNAENALKLVASRRRLFDIGLGGGSQGLSRLPEHLSNPETQGDQHAEVSALR
ncbi:MAG: transposase [Isosphaeraceae bacterium]